MKANTFERVKRIVMDQLYVKECVVLPEAKFVEDLGADSLDIIEMIMTIEDDFGIEISDDDVEKLVTIQDAVTYIQQHQKEKERFSLTYDI